MALKLKSDRYTEIRETPSGAITKGAFIPAATLSGVANGFAAFRDIAAGELASVVIKADAVEIDADAYAFDAGDEVYWDSVKSLATDAAHKSTYACIGYCREDSPTLAAKKILIVFDGATAFEKV